MNSLRPTEKWQTHLVRRPDEDHRSFQKNSEYTRLATDIFKHLATLSTGAILLVLTLSDSLFGGPDRWVTVTCIFFLSTLVASLVAHMGIVITFMSEGKTMSYRWFEVILTTCMCVATAGFSIGIVLVFVRVALKH